MSNNRHKFIRRLLHKLSLSIVGCIFSFCSFLIYYYFILQHLHISRTALLILFSGSILYSIGFAISKQMRCTAVLTIPEFGSTSGKRTIQAVIILLTLSGPIQNMGKNSEHIVYMMTCFSDLAVNITMAGKDVAMAPVRSLLGDMQEDEKEVPTLDMSAVNNLMAPLEEEVLGGVNPNSKLGSRGRTLQHKMMRRSTDSEEEVISEEYKDKLEFSCKEMFSRATTKCQKMFSKHYDKCYETVTSVLAWLLCWPLKLDHMCDIWTGPTLDESCEVAHGAIDAIGSAYLAAKQGLDKFSHLFAPTKIKRGIGKIVDWVENGLDKLEENKIIMRSTFREVNSTGKFIFNILKTALAFVHVTIVFKTLNYHRKYMNSISFDNFYITKYFREIDARRLTEGRTTLLPLKRFETSKYVEVTTCSLTATESLVFLPRVVTVLIQVAVVGLLFLCDFLFVQLLEIVRTHEDFEVQFEGDHILEFTITGAGPLAQVLRSFIKQVNIQHHVRLVHGTIACLPKPFKLSTAIYIQIGTLFFLLIVITFAQVYCRRIRHCVANYFYFQRSKRRTLWLYNEALRRRKRGMHDIKLKLLENADDKNFYVGQNFLHYLFEHYPRLCTCLRCFKLARRKCLLCKLHGETYRCPNCSHSYCEECFNDMNETCQFCVARKEMLQILNDSDDDDEKFVV